jgi:hypothetical protein
MHKFTPMLRKLTVARGALRDFEQLRPDLVTMGHVLAESRTSPAGRVLTAHLENFTASSESFRHALLESLVFILPERTATIPARLGAFSVLDLHAHATRSPGSLEQNHVTSGSLRPEAMASVRCTILTNSSTRELLERTRALVDPRSRPYDDASADCAFAAKSDAARGRPLVGSEATRSPLPAPELAPIPRTGWLGKGPSGQGRPHGKHALRRGLV